MVETITIYARRVIEEVEIRISRTVDRREPVHALALTVTPAPRKAIKARKPVLLLAAPVLR